MHHWNENFKKKNSGRKKISFVFIKSVMREPQIPLVKLIGGVQRWINVLGEFIKLRAIGFHKIEVFLELQSNAMILLILKNCSKHT